jgi:hypothetical protein
MVEWIIIIFLAILQVIWTLATTIFVLFILYLPIYYIVGGLIKYGKSISDHWSSRHR